MSDQHSEQGRRANQQHPRNIEANVSLRGTITIPAPAESASDDEHHRGDAHRYKRFFDIRFSTLAEIFVGVALVGVGILQWCVYQQQAEIMRLDQRPWVNFHTLDKGTQGFVLGKDLIQFGTVFSLENTGKMPASGTNQNFSLRPLADVVPGARNEIADLVKAEQVSVCKGTNYPVGDTVFPGAPLGDPTPVLAIGKRNEFDKLRSEGKPVYVVLLTACVGYQTNIAGEHGHTGASILIGHPGGNGPIIFPTEGTIPADQFVTFRIHVQIAD